MTRSSTDAAHAGIEESQPIVTVMIEVSVGDENDFRGLKSLHPSYGLADGSLVALIPIDETEFCYEQISR